MHRETTTGRWWRAALAASGGPLDRTLRAAAVLALLAAAAAGPAATQLPRVLVITTGGTISLSGQELVSMAAGALVVAGVRRRLVDAIPQLGEIAQIKVEQFVRFGSSSMTPEHWVREVRESRS